MTLRRPRTEWRQWVEGVERMRALSLVLLCLLQVATTVDGLQAGSADVLYVSSPNVPEASGRYEVDDTFPPIRGHLTWSSSGFVANTKTERRIALGSRCSGDVWLIGSTEAVEDNMGWLVTLQSHDGRAPDQVTEWGRVLQQDWTPDPTIRISTEGPYLLETMLVLSPNLDHLTASCSLHPDVRIKGNPVWKCRRGDGTSNEERRWVFMDSHSNWVLGPDYAKDTGWAMASNNGGRMPHQVTDWRRQDGKGGWKYDYDVRFVGPEWVEEQQEPTSDAEGCSKFWLEGSGSATEGPFTATARRIHNRLAFLSVDGSTAIYWCPSSYLLAGKPAWVVAATEDTQDVNSVTIDSHSSHPHCPGHAICEEGTAGDFPAAATACLWHREDGQGTTAKWVLSAETRIACYEDLL